MTKLSRSKFIAMLAPYATADMLKTKVTASLTIAQGVLESADGNSGLTVKANNLFGIKGTGPAGSITLPTSEYVGGKPIKVDAAFRSYHNWGESVADHSALILNGVSWNRNLYKGAIGVDGKTAAKAIAKAGYATDPNYASLLIAIMDDWNLYQYDCVEVEVPMTKDEQTAFDALREDIAAIKIAVESAIKLIPAPKWFEKEFGSADLDGRIHDPRFTAEGWRTLAISLRMQHNFS